MMIDGFLQSQIMFFVSILGCRQSSLFINFSSVHVGQKEDKLEWSPIMDRAATSVFWNELIKGNVLIRVYCSIVDITCFQMQLNLTCDSLAFGSPSMFYVYQATKLM